MSAIPQTAATSFQGIQTAAETALEFSLDTQPDPIRVSPSSGDVERANLVIVGSRRKSDAIECNKIVLTIPTGPNSPDLALDLEGIDAQTSLKDWTVATDPQKKTITFAPTSGHATISRDEGVTLQLMGVRINRQVGTAQPRIEVYSRKAGTNGPFQPDTTTLEIGKFPADFYLRNFIADETTIDNGGTVTLEWEAGGVSSLRLLYDTADINVLNLSTYTVNNIRNSTVFYLRATVQIGNHTAERILATTVTVRFPDLEVNTVFIRGYVTNLNHSVNISEPWTQSHVHGSLYGDSTPTLFTYNNQLHCVSSSYPNRPPGWATLTGDTWNPVPTGLPLGSTECDIIEHDNTLHCVYRTPDNAIYATIGTPLPTHPAQLTWSTPTRITTANWTTTHKPSLMTYAGQLHCMFRHPDGAVCTGRYNPDAGSWNKATPVASTESTHAPAAGLVLNLPGFAFRHQDGTLRTTTIMGMDSVRIPEARTNNSPALVRYKNGLCCAYRDETGMLQYTTKLSGPWTPPAQISPFPSTGAPALASFNDQLHAAYR
ncbi:hypothetical protein [Streptomyces sp. NPDC002209]|uniref:hypothetical protein n=1 Tax=Streptomyces sp. NPDC002209 TaxID=3364638 RepID=UPI0036D11BBB